MEPTWRLADALGDRVIDLLDPVHTFDRVVATVAKATVVCARWEWGTDEEVRGRARVSFELLVEPVTYDLFFNGWDGYRARYWRSAETGQAANLAMLEALRAPLAAAARSWGLHLPAPGFPDRWPQLADASISQSLLDAGAKIWISEHELNVNVPDWQSGVPQHEIVVQPWVESVDRLAEEERKGVGDRQPALIAGTRAPFGSRLAMRGAFLVPGRADLPAVVPAKKMDRAEKIHRYGYS